jgi:hypothetical protein
MAEFHNAGGWKLWGLGDTTPWAGSTTPGRFWVTINNQPANPWGLQPLSLRLKHTRRSGKKAARAFLR